MKKIPLTQGKFALVDDDMYDYLMQCKWSTDKRGKPGRYKYYAYRTANKRVGEKSRKIYMHREVLMLTNEKCDVDHIDHDGINNQRENLRMCTRSQNNMNISYGRGKSKHKGVSWSAIGNAWFVAIAGKYIGYFKSEQDAALAYNEAAILEFGEYACLNEVA